MASNPESVSLLWDTCRIPDFSGDRSGSHLRLVIRIFRFLMSSEARIPTDWVARSFSRLDRLDGNIDTLISRISNVRTWTYVSHRDNWLEDATSWQERTSALENKLSDVLHDRLTQRFVDRKTAVLVRRLREHKKLLAGVGWDGRVTVEGNEMGWLKGFHFVPDNKDVLTSTHLMAAINRALREVVSIRVASIKAADNDAFLLNLSNGTLEWNGAPLAKLTSGSTIVRPHIDILPSELLDSSAISVIRLRLRKWLDYYLISQIRPLLSLSEKTLDGELRGLIYRLTEGLGCSARDNSIDRRSKFIGNNKKTKLTETDIGIPNIASPPNQ